MTGITNYGSATESLDNGKFDIYISPTWPTEERLRQAIFSSPLYRSSVYAWCRPDFDVKYSNFPDTVLRLGVSGTDIRDIL